jgi:hypothetical protein
MLEVKPTMQRSPSGIESTDSASMGGSGKRTSNGMLDYRKSGRSKPHLLCGRDA